MTHTVTHIYTLRHTQVTHRWLGSGMSHSEKAPTALVPMFGLIFHVQKLSTRYLMEGTCAGADPDSCSGANPGNHSFAIRKGCLKPHSRGHKVFCVVMLGHVAARQGSPLAPPERPPAMRAHGAARKARP